LGNELEWFVVRKRFVRIEEGEELINPVRKGRALTLSSLPAGRKE
jgi:hypothetical protein